MGSGTLFNGVVSFDANSYTDWSAQFTSSASTPGTGPATSLWKHETIDLTPWQGSSTFKFRFRYTSDPSVVYYGWLIDNVTITGTGQAPVTWLPVANLYTDPAATVPYVGGTSYLVVYTKPPGSVIYTATASGGSCSSSATANLTVTGVVVNVSIAANPGTTICNGGCVTFTATPTNGGTTPFYTWKVNGGTVASGIGMNTYTSCTLATGNLVTCVLLSNVGSCASNNPATSNTLTMTVNPNPTVNITGLTTVCNNAPPTVLTANASVAPGSIATYEWFLGAVSQGVPSAINTFNATLPGSYTVVATTVAGCPTTSAPFVVTLPTYTITATSGPNGTISPSGAVVVNCGDDITFTMTPNAFYSIFDVLVDGSSVGPVGTYTFMNVTAPHTISVTFFLVGCPTPATADAGPDGSFCANATYTLAGSITNASTIIWTGGTGTYNPNNTTLNAIYTPGPGEVGGISVTLTLTTNDPPGPCVASSDNVTLTIRTIPSVSITGVAGFCPSSSTTLTAVASITPAGPITYAWLYNGVTSLGTAVTQVSSSGAGNYQVTATANSCSNTASVAVVAFVSPSVTITGSNLICTGTPTTLSASVVAGSGAIPINGYQWYRNAVLIAGATSSTYATTLAANYTVTITDANGCISALSPIFTLSNDLSPLNGIYTISAAPASCTNYTSFALAINDLNTRFVGGDVTFNISAGYTETAPVLGLPLGSAGLNASLAGRTLSFKKVGIGANPLITAYAGGTATPSSAIPDGIWSLRGVDNVIIDAIDLVDNNASGNAMMEYGYGLFKASTTDGTQNITIQNCTITLNKVNNAASVAPMLEGSTAILVCNSTATTATTATTPTAASGTNSNNKFYTNIIQNCNHGIALSGYAAASPFTLGDTGNDIGGLSGTTGNTIVNFGGGGALVACGIRLLNQWSSNVSFNTVNNNNGAGINHTGILRGIYGQAGLGASVTISNNIITVNSGGNTALCSGIENSLGASGAANTVIISNNTVTGSIALATTALFSAIVNTSTANATTVNMNGNIVENCTLPATGTGAWTGISNQAVVATLSLSNNILRNCTISSVGAFTGIANSSATAVTSQNISGNEISGNVKANATPINWMATGLYTTSLVNNNTVINNTVNAAATAVTVNCILASSTGGVVTADGNLISNNSITGITAGIATLSGISNIASTTGETYSNNLIRKLFVTGTATTFLHVIQGLNTNTAAASAKTISGNTVANLYSSSTLSATVYGIRNATGATVNIFKNKIDSLFPGQNGATAGSLASGIRIQSGTTVNTHDNYINLDLTAATAPAANAVLTANDALKGVEYTAVTAVTLNLYYNTIRLAGAGSGANFGSSGVGIISTTPTVDMRNNIIVNLTTPGGSATGLAVAYRRPAAVGATYSTNSNNNLFYSGVPSASRLLYFDGTTGYQTMATYQAGAGIAPREGVSVNVSPNFISATNLHLMPGKNCSTDGQAQVIAGYTGDYDTDVRSGTFPDIGADEFNGTGVGIGVWAGTIDGDWNNVLNWCDAVPDSKVNVTIPAGAPNYPAITSLTLPAPAAKNFTIAVGGTVTITGTGKLGIYGTVSNSGTFNTVDGTIEMASTAAAQTIPAATFQNNDLKNLIISNNAGAVTLGGTLNLYGKLSYTKSTCTFATAGFLVLRSTAAGTAYVADITNVGANAGNTITGDVSVERFMGMRRAWRLLAAPTQHNLQNIHQAWQENQAPNATTPVGYGIQMTSSAATWAADGFDMSTPAGPSIKVYNPALNVWDPLPATVGASGNFTAGKGYMTLVRGDRTINFFQAVATTTTVLRDKGLLNTNTFAAPAIGAAQFALIGNPFASAVDFTKFTKTNLQDVYYLWDPYLGSLGGYVTFAGPSYTPTPSLSYTSNKFIESGQAFFVRSSGPAGTLSFPEVSKVSGSYLVSRPAAPGKQLQANLYLIDAGGRNLYDGVTSEFDGSYSNTVDNQDALKLSNFGENLGIRRNDKTLSVERMKELVKTDTIFYNLGQMRVKHYQFEFTPDNIGQTGLAAFLEDRYLNIKTPVSLTDITTVDFTIINEPGSYAPDRFRIVFALAGPVPVTFSSIRANRQRNDILVEWKVENELNIAHYDVEKSADGLNFSKVNETAARGNGSGAAIQYNWLDTNPFDGNNFYRIRSVGISNEAKLSQIVKVDMGKLPASITVFPNPVREDGMLYIGLSNQPAGVYQLALVNSTGQTMMKQSLNHAGGNSVYSIMMDKYVAHGNYLVNIAGNNNVKLTFKVVY